MPAAREGVHARSSDVVAAAAAVSSASGERGDEHWPPRPRGREGGGGAVSGSGRLGLHRSNRNGRAREK